MTTFFLLQYIPAFYTYINTENFIVTENLFFSARNSDSNISHEQSDSPQALPEFPGTRFYPQKAGKHGP